MRVAVIEQLWRYPVKSMAGERLERVPLAWRGIPGDRGWAVYDETRAGITGAKRLPALRACRARYPDEPTAVDVSPRAEVTLPDGRVLQSDATDATQRLGQLLGRPVSLRALAPAGGPSIPRITTAGESPETIREIMGLLPGEPPPDMSAFTPERLQALRQGNFFDAFPLHLLTRTTLRTLASLAPESVWDERRFRSNLLLESTDPHGYPELEWIGHRLRVGTATIEVVTGCPRCVVVTQAVDEVPQDHRIMRTLVRETKHTAGVYARVVEEGELRVGDAVTLLP